MFGSYLFFTFLTENQTKKKENSRDDAPKLSCNSAGSTFIVIIWYFDPRKKGPVLHFFVLFETLFSFPLRCDFSILKFFVGWQKSHNILPPAKYSAINTRNCRCRSKRFFSPLFYVDSAERANDLSGSNCINTSCYYPLLWLHLRFLLSSYSVNSKPSA